MAEAVEVATRDFVDLAVTSGNPRAYLQARATHQGIVVHELDVATIPNRSASLFIVGTYQQLEGFLYDFVDEFDLTVGAACRRRNQGEAPLDWILDVLPGGLALNKQRIWIERYLLLEYYRLVRNFLTHPRKGKGTLTAAHATLTTLAPMIWQQCQLPPPSLPAQLGFEDFLLFTRMAKYVATDLCRIAHPTFEFIHIFPVSPGVNPHSLDHGLSGTSRATHHSSLEANRTPMNTRGGVIGTYMFSELRRVDGVLELAIKVCREGVVIVEAILLLGEGVQIAIASLARRLITQVDVNKRPTDHEPNKLQQREEIAKGPGQPARAVSGAVVSWRPLRGWRRWRLSRSFRSGTGLDLGRRAKSGTCSRYSARFQAL